ncbi:hypothetical protein CHLNCDRAFT_58390 [Chlorella variabilis]|uniref:Transmembrane protein n=1 Tax=Chlorella variabilis TaxID=554065 RepID=E1ZJU8_CHLVA|nr:hypothetical protein CHLNCDRAFT_58390 [Chlorella variabilis]EFN54056.1 hypothetical protein CHLNCDRAFT_58390 [Chlorella variabilis]|eukprot:XP_005846158.1 hypothetical protein CHLNCDRAFT_58390 [Chlorella variabilis]
MGQPWAYYGKVAGVCFALGAGMEYFMIKTGFYEKVTEIEAQRLEETREDRERFLAELRAELERQAAQKGVKLALPPTPHSSSSSSSSSNSSSGGMSRQ